MPAQKHKKIYYLVSLLVGMSLLLAACSAPAPAPTPTTVVEPAATSEPANVLDPITQEELVGAVWQWAGGREPLSSPPFQVPAPEKYTLTFSEDGSLFVQADCNTSRGTYELSDSQLTITLGATTLVACDVDSLSDHFMANLGKAATAGSGFGNLVIGMADEAGEMYFQRTAAPDLASNLEPITQEDMVDILWKWTSLEEPPPAPGVGVGDPSLYDIVFRADGTYSAKADCNRLNGAYTLNGSQLTINPGISTLVACDPESRSDQYASLLWRVTGVAQKEGMLVLLVDDGSSAMSFVNAGESPVATPAPVVESDPASVLGAPDGVENFDSANNWTNFTSQCFNSEITGGQFVMTANGVPQFSCWEVSWPQLQNFYIDTTQLMPTTCQPDDRFGLLFRAPDLNRGYLYGFNCAGQYVLTVWDGETTTTLVRPTASDAIRQGPGAVNVMGLMAFGENISLYANGVFLQTVADFTFLDVGRLGYFVRAATENPFTVRYDQLRVWSLEDELFPPDLSQTFPTEDLPTPGPNVPTGEARVNVNVRTGPSTLFPILGTAMQGDTGQILGINPNGSWYAVSVPPNRVGTGIAWVSADFVNLTNPTGQPLPVIPPPLLPTTVNFPAPAPNVPQVVMREPATLRSGPTLEFPVFGVAPNGSRAELIGQSQDGEWWAIRVPTSLTSDGTAWVAKAYTSVVNAGSVPTLRTPDLPRNITPAAPASGAPALVTIEPLSVRKGPGGPFGDIGRVARGTVMAVIGISPDREWYVVNIPTSIDPSGRGWIAVRFTRSENTANVPVVQPPPAP
jgi:heat shock protein HslJ/uncharacterized protein YraI